MVPRPGRKKNLRLNDSFSRAGKRKSTHENLHLLQYSWRNEEENTPPGLHRERGKDKSPRRGGKSHGPFSAVKRKVPTREGGKGNGLSFFIFPGERKGERRSLLLSGSGKGDSALLFSLNEGKTFSLLLLLGGGNPEKALTLLEEKQRVFLRSLWRRKKGLAGKKSDNSFWRETWTSSCGMKGKNSLSAAKEKKQRFLPGTRENGGSSLTLPEKKGTKKPSWTAGSLEKGTLASSPSAKMVEEKASICPERDYFPRGGVEEGYHSALPGGKKGSPFFTKGTPLSAPHDGKGRSHLHTILNTQETKKKKKRRRQPLIHSPPRERYQK